MGSREQVDALAARLRGPARARAGRRDFPLPERTPWVNMVGSSGLLERSRRNPIQDAQVRMD